MYRFVNVVWLHIAVGILCTYRSNILICQNALLTITGTNDLILHGSRKYSGLCGQFHQPTAARKILFYRHLVFQGHRLAFRAAFSLLSLVVLMFSFVVCK